MDVSDAPATRDCLCLVADTSLSGTGHRARLGAWRPVPLRHRAQQAQIRNRLYSAVDEKRGSRQFEGDRLMLRREQAASGGKRIEEYYTRAAHPYLNETVQRWKRIVGAEPGRFVQVMDLGYRWGSCSADGTLNFHWRVMQLPARIIEYVVVHELVHIKVPNHSEEFWKMLGSVIPDYESRKAWLKQKGGEL